MSYPPLPSNGETNWGNKFRTWADALEGRKVEGTGMTLRRDWSIGERIFLDHSGGSTILYGDTGVRDISGFLTNGATGKIFARIHTLGAQPWVTLSSVYNTNRLDTTNATAIHVLNLTAAQLIPAISSVGSYTTFGEFWTGASGNGTPVPVGVTVYDGDRMLVIRANQQLHGVVSYPIEAWPTTPPGTPV